MDLSGPRQGNRSGFVYFLATENFEYVKVGCTTNLDKRIRQLAIQLPFRVSLYHHIETDDMHWLETLIHREYQHLRANGEWFHLPRGFEQFEGSFSHHLANDIWTTQDEANQELYVRGDEHGEN